MGNVKNTLHLILTLIVAAALVWVAYRVIQYGDIKAQNTELQNRVTTLENDSKRYDAALQRRSTQDQTARANRAGIEDQLTRNASHDSTVAAYLDARIPDGVRSAYAEDNAANNGGAAGPDQGRGSLRNDQGGHGGPAVNDPRPAAPLDGR